jgi:hypothetical protein
MTTPPWNPEKPASIAPPSNIPGRKAPTAHSGLELQMIKKRTIEFYEITFPKVRFMPLDESEGGMDEFYNERTPKVVAREYWFRALVRLNPPLQLLQKYGIDVQHDSMVIIPRALLERENFFPRIGDRFEFATDSGTRQFRIDTVKPADYWTNTEYNLFVVMTAEGAEDQLVPILKQPYADPYATGEPYPTS